MSNTVPKGIRKHLWHWNLIAGLHRILHVILGVVGITFPLIIACFADALSTTLTRGLSFAAAASIAVFAAFEIGNRATRFREAWKLLNAASFEYEEGLIKIDDLLEAYRKGEKIIGQLKPDPFAKGSADQGIDRDHQ